MSNWAGSKQLFFNVSPARRRWSDRVLGRADARHHHGQAGSARAHPPGDTRCAHRARPGRAPCDRRGPLHRGGRRVRPGTLQICADRNAIAGRDRLRCAGTSLSAGPGKSRVLLSFADRSRQCTANLMRRCGSRRSNFKLRGVPAAYLVIRLGEIGSLAGKVSSIASSSNCS